MAGIVSAEAIKAWAASRAPRAIDLRWIVPLGVLIVLFKLAISDGGRHLPTLALAQVVVFSLLGLLMFRRALPRISIAGPIVIMVVLVTASAMWSVRPEAGLRQGLLWLLYSGILVLTASSLRSSGGARQFVDGAVAIACWLCLIALFLFWGNNAPGMRWYSTFYWPNPFAGFLLLVLPVELVRFLRAQPTRAALSHGATAVLLGTSLVLTYSRGAWLALAATLPAMVLLLRPPSCWVVVRRVIVLAGIVAASTLLLTQGAPTLSTHTVMDRAASIANPGDHSWQGRLHFWRAAWDVFRDHPVLGTGAGTFGAVHAAYQRDVRFYASDAHNVYVQALAELGILGVVAFAVVLGSFAAVARRALAAARGGEDEPLVVGVALGVLAFLLHSAVDVDWRFPANPALLFALVGVLTWYDRAAREADPGHGPRVLGKWSLVGAPVVAAALMLAMVFQSAERAFSSGHALARGGQWVASADRYAQAARRNPLSARNRGAYAVTVVQADPSRWEEGAASLRAAMRLDRMNASHPLQLARLIMDRPAAPRAQLAEAEVLIQQALRLDPWNRPEAYRMLAALYLRQGRSADADRVYQDAIARYVHQHLGTGSPIYLLLWPEVVGLFLDAADGWARSGNTSQAAQVLEVLLAEDPRSILAALRLSALYVALGRSAEARAVLLRTTAYVPENEDLKSALRALP